VSPTITTRLLIIVLAVSAFTGALEAAPGSHRDRPTLFRLIPLPRRCRFPVPATADVTTAGRPATER
jgi:hypothetical protein